MIAARAVATTVLYSLVVVNIQPASLSAAVPSAFVADPND
jgi:hypothetical protein